MIIQYDLTIDDVLAFNRYHCANSTAVKRIKRVCTACGVLVICVFVSLVQPNFGFGWPEALGIMALTSVIFYLLYNALVVRALDWQVKRMVNEGSTKGFLGQHELEITPQSLIERTDYNESLHQWRGLAEIVETDSHIFIYISAMMAHVIPRGRLTRGDARNFVDQATAFLQASRESHGDHNT